MTALKPAKEQVEIQKVEIQKTAEADTKTQEYIGLERLESQRPRASKSPQIIPLAQNSSPLQSSPASMQSSSALPSVFLTASSPADPLVSQGLVPDSLPVAVDPPVESTPLVLASDLSLPLEAVTETFAILAKRGSGKTYCASVLVEEMLKAGQTVVVADPVGVWWGLRSSADGLGAGLPIVILGGDHGDAPLLPEAGAAVADLAAGERYSLVLDLSHFTPPEQTRFMTAFAERLYRVNRLPLHLVLDEADQFTPQVPEAGQQPLLWAMNRIVRLGRARGLGVTLISQRPAVLAKNVLTQTEVLITLRLTSPQDRKAVEAWVSAHDDSGRRQEMLASLPSLPVGTAWLWSPGWLDLLQKVQVRRRETFDSSATPKVSSKPDEIMQNGRGQGRTQPVALAPVDLNRLREKLAAVEAVTLDDAEPAELRRRLQAAQDRIQNLEAGALGVVAARGAKPAEAVRLVEVIRRVEVPMLLEVPVLAAGEAAQLQETVAEMTTQAEALRTDALRLVSLAERMEGMAQTIVLRLDQAAAMSAVPDGSESACQESAAPLLIVPPPLRSSESVQDNISEEQDVIAGKDEAGRYGAGKDDGGVAGDGEKTPLAERKVLRALAQYPEGRRKNQVALLTGYAVTGGGFNNALSSLRSKTWVIGRDVLKITDAGRAALGPGEALPAPGPALVEAWALRLPKADRLILQALAQVHPGSLTKERLGQAAGYEPTGGGFNNALSRLRTLALIEGRGELRATDALCLP